MASTSPRLLAGLLVLIVVAASGCGMFGSSDDTPESITGFWSGEVSVEDTAYTVEIDLQQEGPTVVTGTGTVRNGDDTMDFRVENAAYNHPSLSFQLNYDEQRPANFVKGTVDEAREQIDGRLTGPPVEEADLTFVRQ